MMKKKILTLGCVLMLAAGTAGIDTARAGTSTAGGATKGTAGTGRATSFIAGTDTVATGAAKTAPAGENTVPTGGATDGTAKTATLLTFEEAVSLALQRNPRIAVARNSARIAKNNVHIGNANLLPRLDLTGTATYQEVDPPTGPASDISGTGARMSASYTLFDGFENIYSYRLLQSAGRLGELEARDQIERTLITVGNAYYGAAAAFENLEIAKHLLEISRERMARTSKRAEFGQGGTVDVLAAEVDFNSDTVTVVQARFAWEEARRNL
ncbi:MAG: TolC family protein, partial [Candidatus Krumholzibacteriota bacterium]|nr:TolC family protein [Candidatus Krumholzibacteriota bacterium]